MEKIKELRWVPHPGLLDPHDFYYRHNFFGLDGLPACFICGKNSQYEIHQKEKI